MGRELRLLPLDSRPPHVLGFSHTVLPVRQDHDLFVRIDALRPRPIPSELEIDGYGGARVPDGYAKGELMYGLLVQDGRGKPYTWLAAGDLASAFDENTRPLAMIAYVRALPSDHLIILYWC